MSANGKEIVEKKRRQFERILFQNFFGIETTVSIGDDSCEVQLIDVSYNGCLFRVLEKDAPRSIKVGSDLTLKIYFTEHNYISVLVNIKRSAKAVGEEGYCWREYGCKFDKSLSSFRAMEAFVDFLYKFAECSSADYGTRNVYIA